jgi:hypothetical protein
MGMLKKLAKFFFIINVIAINDDYSVKKNIYS